MKKRGSFNSRAQIWVETVVYTLIGLSIIAFVLAISIPKIEELRDRNVLESSKHVLSELDSKIREVSLNPGTQRIVYVDIKKGKIILDGKDEEIMFSFVGSYKYSELNNEINELGVIIKTEETKDGYKTIFKIKYAPLNLTINSQEEIEELEESTKPYKLIILNKGNSNININIEK